MRVILTKQEVIEATVSYLKSKNVLLPDVEYSANISEYSSREYFTVSEAEVKSEEKAKEDVA